MLERARRRHRTRELLPVNLLYLPYWISRTVSASRSSAPDRARSPAPAVAYLGPSLRRPVFIIGAPRSGTTFLGECVARLPEISYFYEPVLTKAAVTHVYTGAWSTRLSTFVYRATYRWLMRLRAEPHLRFCEKTPGNCFIVPFLAKAFPDGVFVHIVRDGRDSALSLVAKGWYGAAALGRYRRDQDGYLFGPGNRFWVEPERTIEYESTDDLHRCNWLWRRHVETARRDLAHLPPSRVLSIRYEDLLQRPGEHASRLLDFLEIGSESSRALFGEYLRREASLASIGKWETLSEEQRERAWKESGECLAAYGYERHPVGVADRA